ncbi:MAG: helix-turn-helix transcriptional regulator [Alphaproteobacteria bacterium]
MHRDDFIYNVGRRIASLRKIKGVSQEELAAKCERVVNTISNLERGLGDPKISTLKKIAQSLDVSILTILDVDEINDSDYKKSNEITINRIVALLKKIR